MTTTNNTILITRPKLVTFLMAHGVEVTPSPNPWRPDLRAWTVKNSPEAKKLIDRFMEAARAEGAAE